MKHPHAHNAPKLIKIGYTMSDPVSPKSCLITKDNRPAAITVHRTAINTKHISFTSVGLTINTVGNQKLEFFSAPPSHGQMLFSKN